MLDKKLFRVYFHDKSREIFNYLPFNYRHIIADNKEDAENMVKELIE